MQALGTLSGNVYLTDHAGSIRRQWRCHRGRVNDISIDLAGDHFATCSDDGTVVITPVNAGEVQTVNYHRPIACVRLDPNFTKSRERPCISGGAEGAVKVNQKSWSWRGVKQLDVDVHKGDGPIRSLAWHGAMIAWATDHDVKVMQWCAVYVDP